MKVFFALACVVVCAQSAVVKREAEAEAEAYYGHLAPVVPLVYHTPNCTTVEETITVKQCTPKIDNQCEDVEIPIQTIEYEEVCTDVTTKICTPKVVEAAGEEEGAEKAKREAEADAEAHIALPYAAYPLHHVVQPVLYTTVCEDKVDKHCYQNPVVKAGTKTVKSCQAVASVDCQDIEHKIPRTTCTPVPIVH